MKTVTRTKPLIAALHGELRGTVPVWLMRQAGRYLPEYRELRARARDFLDFCYSPDLATEATLQPIRRFCLDGAILFSDILVIPDALGQRVTFVEGQGPVLEPLSRRGGIDGLSSAALRTRLSPVYDALGRTSRALPEGVALIGFAGAPWTIASYMIEGGTTRDFTALKRWAYGDRDSFGDLIALLVDAVADHLIAQAEAGAEVLQIFDSWAGILPEEGFEAWCIKPVAEIVRRVKSACPSVPVILFPKGAGFQYERIALETGVDAVSVDSTVPLGFARRTLQEHVTVQGNLDPVALVVGGETMRSTVRGILDALGRGPFVFNLGHGVLPDTPPEHVAALVDEVRRWRH